MRLHIVWRVQSTRAPWGATSRTVFRVMGRCATLMPKGKATARKTAAGANVPLFINARTDVFLGKPAEARDAAMVHAVLDRARAYAQAGADGLFVPGVIDEMLIERLVEGSPLPVNIMVEP